MADFTKLIASAAELAPARAIDTEKNPQVVEALRTSFLAQNFSLGYAINLGGGGVKAETPNNPVYDKPAETLGVLRQVDKINDTFLLAKRGILDLRSALANNPPGDGTKSLLERISVYLKNPDYTSQGERQTLLAGFYANPENSASFNPLAPEPIANPGEDMAVEVEGKNAEGVTAKSTVQVKRSDHAALFATGRVMTSDIRQLDTLRHALTVLRRNRQLKLAQKQTELAALREKIPLALNILTNLDAARQEALGDHALAKRLLAEHWSAVEQAWAERRRVLESNLGLYYVRVRETPLSLALPDPLELRHGDADDIVPGCSGEITDIPPALAPFLEAVYDVPVADWAGLRDLYPLLPERFRIEVLVNQRREQLSKRQSMTGGSALFTRLQPLHQEALALSRHLVKLPFVASGALSAVQQQGSQLLGLDDLLTGPAHRLRPQAASLHQKLGNAAACLALRLRGISPSIRLDWAEAAENDWLKVEEPERWPGLERAEAGDFNGVRTLVELVHWWFRQLHGQASGGARTALRNYVRAAVLHAASDDPAQILRGNVATLPGRFRIGEMLRLNLNREAAPGALLSLMDPEQRVVGTLRVDDFDGQGAVAVITHVLDSDVRPTTAWQVLGKAR